MLCVARKPRGTFPAFINTCIKKNPVEQEAIH